MELTKYDRRASVYESDYLQTMARGYIMVHKVRQALDAVRGKTGHKRSKAIWKAWRRAQIAARGHALTIAREPGNDHDLSDYCLLIDAAAKKITERDDRKPLPDYDEHIPF